MRKLGLWLQEELNVSDDYFDIVFKTSRNRYRVHQFSATWWIIEVLSAAIVLLAGMMVVFMLYAFH